MDRPHVISCALLFMFKIMVLEKEHFGVITKQRRDKRSREIKDTDKTKKNREKSCSTKGKTKRGGLR